MTFSDTRVIDLVKKNFVAVWESVAPVRTAIFDLGDGKQVKGTTGGETALFFCTPDGLVFDLLPALHSPKAVHESASAALKLYRSLPEGDPAPTVAAHHASRLGVLPPIGEPAKRKTLRERWTSGYEPGSADLSRMSLSKSGLHTASESVVVVEPGGMTFYRRQVHQLLCRMPLRKPAGLRKEVFEGILNEPLGDRGEVVYSFDTPTPFSIHESPGDFDIDE